MTNRNRITATLLVLLLPMWTVSADDLIPPQNVHVVGQWDEHPVDYTAADVWADDRGYAYVCNRSPGTMNDPASVDIMDIRNPAGPQLLTIYDVPPPNNFSVAKDVKYHDGLLFVGLDDDGNDGCQIVDVRDPANPTHLVNIHIPGFADVHNLFYDKGYLYLANSRSPEVAIIDLTNFDPDTPPAETITDAKWLVTNVGTGFVHDVTAQNGRLYAAAWDSGLWIYDVSNIANEPPQFIASAPGDSTHACWPTADGRWIVTNEERSDGGPVKLYEYTEPEGIPTLTHTFTFAIPTTQAPSSHNVYVVGYRAYCAWYNRGLMAFDINPEFKWLELVAHHDTSTETANFLGAWGVYPFNGRDKVLVSDKQTQLWIFDIRVPASGDYDGDADNDILDYSALTRCFATNGTPYEDPSCETLDFDDDNDVDLIDYAELRANQTGPR